MAQEHPADITREQWLRNQLLKLAEKAEQIEESKSWQAAVAARRLLLQYRNELDDIRREQEVEGDFQPTSIDDIVAELLKLPDAVYRHPDIVKRVQSCT
jgi:hypothetical protein